MKERTVRILDYIIEYNLYLLLFFLPLSKAPLQVFSGMAFVAFVIKKIIKPDFKFINSPLHYCLFAFILFSVLSMFNSGPLLGKSLTALFFKWMKYIGMFLFFEDTFVTRKRIRNALIILFASSLLVGIDGLFQRFSGVDFIRGWELIPVVPTVFGVNASFNHYNDFGVYLIVILSLVIALSISGRLNKISFTFLIGLEILLSVCLMFTFSRGAWLGFVITMCLMLILSSRNMARKMVFLIPLFVGILVLIPELRDRLIFTFTPRGDADRIKVWHAAFIMIKENPFLGKGIGLFMDNFSRLSNLNTQYTHNCYLQIWAETGIFALLSFLGFVGVLLVNGIKAFKINQNFLLLGLVCGIFGYLVHSFFDTQLYSIQTSFLFWSMAGILSVLSSKQIEV